MRKANDLYPTPHSIIWTVIRMLGWRSPHFWEPCAGDGRFADALDNAHGVRCLRHDIETGYDFFDWKYAQRPDIVTNPPFKVIRQFIDHAFAIGVQRMALVCPERLWACNKGFEQKQRHNPSRFINLAWREDYLGKGGSPDRALAISIWDMPNAPSTTYQVCRRS